MKILFTGFIFILLTTFTYSQPGPQQQICQIVSRGNVEVPYVQSGNGGPASVQKEITVKLRYKKTRSTAATPDLWLKIGVFSKTAAPASDPTIGMTPFTIPASSFETYYKDTLVKVVVTLRAVNAYTPEFFMLGLQDSAGVNKDISESGLLHVSIAKDKNKEFIKKDAGFTYLNAFNFDFNNQSNSGYVGHLNVYAPNIEPLFQSSFWRKFGMNLGIMKINYSIGGDSLNSSYAYTDTTKVNPLDPVVPGTPFYRQYNKLQTVSNNVSVSFYFQPTIALVENEHLDVLFHLHSEFFVDSWTTKNTLENIQQVEDIITQDNLSLVSARIRDDNPFKASLNETVVTENKVTRLSFYYGAGVTLTAQLWDGGELFVQPTFGKATRYAVPVSANNNAPGDGRDKTLTFHLTNFELREKITSNLQLIAGVIVRGRFGADPTYANYFGMNIGLSGLKKVVTN
ncbi:hypothetical protein [Parasegetibacter sp. NRK P23]|uniref:hypothetical protein n=1 Tax=Parasegetibacter sp. NRK P23 TaxID=2942999 RepID=UPI00204387AA|nr:hypothetical protein [Parasegetibacter sp. NRK P23]MCM5528346.1 hypothetical protein [Parasegetibacter sp. NRK P23]